MTVPFSRRWRFAVGTGLALLGAVSPASAAPAGLIDFAGQIPACDKADDKILCLVGLGDRSAARMRAALAKARAAIAKSPTIREYGSNAEALKTLERGQRAWQAYVKARCAGEVAVSFTGGTGRNWAVLSCYKIHNDRRAAELDDLARMD